MVFPVKLPGGETLEGRLDLESGQSIILWQAAKTPAIVSAGYLFSLGFILIDSLNYGIRED
ncbi:MAG: hypothetical protein ACETWC_08745 [Acidobacteriota bacterium]